MIASKAARGDEVERLERKKFSSLAACFALAGFAVHETAKGGFLVCRWNLSRHCSDLTELEAFARKVGAVR